MLQKGPSRPALPSSAVREYIKKLEREANYAKKNEDDLKSLIKSLKSDKKHLLDKLTEVKSNLENSNKRNIVIKDELNRYKNAFEKLTSVEKASFKYHLERV